MQESIVNKSPRRRIARRIGAAVMALAAVLTLGACTATGGGYLPPEGPGGVFQGQANFGFNFTCEIETVKKGAVIRGTITYHDDPSPMAPKGVRLHGTVDPLFIPNETNCADAIAHFPLFEGARVARFAGDYRSQDTTLPAPMEQGRFQVDVFDRGVPSNFDGDYFDILLTGGEYSPPYNPPYNRAGEIEGGNIRVED